MQNREKLKKSGIINFVLLVLKMKNLSTSKNTNTRVTPLASSPRCGPGWPTSATVRGRAVPQLRGAECGVARPPPGPRCPRCCRSFWPLTSRASPGRREAPPRRCHLLATWVLPGSRKGPLPGAQQLALRAGLLGPRAWPRPSPPLPPSETLGVQQPTPRARRPQRASSKCSQPGS